MRVGIRLLICGFAMLGLAACASVPQTASSGMILGGAAVAPPGFVEFCDRRPAECSAGRPAASQGTPQAETARLSQDAGQAFWSSAFAQARANQDRSANPLMTGALSRTSGLSAIGSRNAPTPRAQPAAASPDVGRVTLTPELWALIEATNRKVNRAITPASDISAIGRGDYWSMPLEDGGKAYGDCEDYVLEKRHALIAAGVPAGALSIAVAQIRSGEIHAVLLVITDKGDYVLDNLSQWVLPWSRVDYAWISRQRAGAVSEWATISGRTDLALNVGPRQEPFSN